nr:RNA-binding protein Musashi homolog 2 isoform X3 [Anser cygnoides]
MANSLSTSTCEPSAGLLSSWWAPAGAGARRRSSTEKILPTGGMCPCPVGSWQTPTSAAPAPLSEKENHRWSSSACSLLLTVCMCESTKPYKTVVIFHMQVEDAMLMFDKTTNRHRALIQAVRRGDIDGNVQAAPHPPCTRRGEGRRPRHPVLNRTQNGACRKGEACRRKVSVYCGTCIQKVLGSLLLKMKTWWKKSVKFTSTKSIIKWLPEFCCNVWPRISWICPKLQLSIPSPITIFKCKFSGSGLWTSSSGSRGSSKRIRLQPSPARRLPRGQQPRARRRPLRHGQPGLRRRQLHKRCQPTAGLRLRPRDRQPIWMSGQDRAKFLSGPMFR